MIETKELIIRGCKFILNLGADKWESKLNRKAITRLRDLCQLQLDEWDIPKEKEVRADQMSNEQITEIFKPE